MCDSKSGIQAFTCTRASSEAATWGSEIQLGSLRRSLIILESFLETFFGPILLNYPPCSYPPPFYGEVWGRRVVFRVCVNSQSGAGSRNINRQSIYKRVGGAVRSLGNLRLAF